VCPAPLTPVLRLRIRIIPAQIVDTIEGTALKRLAQDKPFGVVVLAEGLVEKMAPEEVACLRLLFSLTVCAARR